MIRVPVSAERPTFDDTFKVSTLKWLKSSQAERDEWARRRDVAAEVARQNQNTRGAEAIEAWGERHKKGTAADVEDLHPFP
jgi:hypothetical protein